MRLQASASCFQRVPCPLVQFEVGQLFDAYRRRSQSADRGKDAAHHDAGDGHLGQLEDDGADVADEAGSNLNQLELKAGQRPVGHRSGQFDKAQKRGQVASQGVQSHVVVAEPLLRQPCPADGIVAFVDVLLGDVSSIVKAGDLVRFHGQVDDDAADLWDLTYPPKFGH